ncbi:virB8 family protein [Glacieibacterium sp.]|uniref:virB8 family protein n=1 Tax=Glacieibacterium sp. TaxID=2860237 RepID=UPI003AFF7675
MDQITPARSTYYADAATWSDDVNGSLRASRRLAWIVAGLAVFVAVLEALALVLLTPLKTVVPYTITVDRQTGNAQLARGIVLGPRSQNDALVQSALAQYVIARETLDATDLAANYRKVGLWSASTARSDYLRSMDRKNPASVLNGATAATEISTTIKQVTLMSPTSALVRFATDRREGDGPVTRMDWAAVLQFAFTGGPLSMEDRLVNPLGFQVTHYRRDAEALAPRVIVPTAVPTAVPASTTVTSTTTTSTVPSAAPSAIVVPTTLPRLVNPEPVR